MTRLIASAAIVALASCVLTASGHADTIAVANASFESLPSNGLPYGCGAGCAYSVDAIPGWTVTGNTGQFQPGPAQGNFAYYNYVPDGATVAYTNGGSITQTVATTATAGTTYTLSVALGLRNDGYPDAGTVNLVVGGQSILATGAPATLGGWSTYTASYTATAADAGGAISINLADTSPQGGFDAVSLTSTAVPEPASWTLMLLGLAGIGSVYRRARAGLNGLA